MINREHVLHIARLARLKLTEEEIGSFTEHLGSILEYVEQLNKVDTVNIEPTSLMAPSHSQLREDVEVESLTQDQVLANGPNVKKGCFAIPKVIGG
jgi:aspartyl-tRNA(Asn)/glutamyl-tRNA(Gln) amidotransferase subunit C